MTSVTPMIDALRSQVRSLPAVRRLGHVTSVTGLIIESEGPNVGLGELCKLSSERDNFSCLAEVVGFRGEKVLLMPLGDTSGLHAGCEVAACDRPPMPEIGPKLMGRVLDALGNVDNDASLERYREMALVQAASGSQLLGLSGMMDGQVAAVRETLDAAGFVDTSILAYSAKYASAYYGPFREAAESAPAFGDRRSYQMDPPNRREALREMRLDLEEGADVLMVKPALPYLDVLAEARRAFDVPLAAYHVSGEYAMIRAAAERGWIDGERALEEALVAIKRAGADWILTYAAKEIAGRLS